MPLVALIGGIVLLVISADKFVEGAATCAKIVGLPPLLIGMIVIGFGSSMPEMVISGLSASGGNPGLALGNAFGSNIANIALILGITALISPISVQSRVPQRELPYLLMLTAFAALLFYDDGYLSKSDGWSLMMLFLLIMAWSIYEGMTAPSDALGESVDAEYIDRMSGRKALIYMILGLIFLVISSRILVWGGVEIATMMGISDLIIGLTIVAIGTSLPELAAAIAAVRKNEHELALGNVIGSNMFNTSIVVGITGTLAPTALDPDLLQRDLVVVIILTIAMTISAWNFSGRGGRINRWEGGLLLFTYVFYTAMLVVSTKGGAFF